MALENLEAEPMQVDDAVPQVEGAEPGESALHANIKSKGQNAYYFAHRKRDTGEEPAPLPVHIPLEVVAVQAPAEVYEAITSGYQFLDDKKHVKVYLPLEGVGEKCSAAGQVNCEYNASSFCLLVRGYKDGRTLRFEVKQLCGAIDTQACSHKVLANKVVLTLVKAGDTPPSWKSLTSAI